MNVTRRIVIEKILSEQKSFHEMYAAKPNWKQRHKLIGVPPYCTKTKPFVLFRHRTQTHRVYNKYIRMKYEKSRRINTYELYMLLMYTKRVKSDTNLIQGHTEEYFVLVSPIEKNSNKFTF